MNKWPDLQNLFFRVKYLLVVTVLILPAACGGGGGGGSGGSGGSSSSGSSGGGSGAEPSPTLSISDASIVEGDGGMSVLQFEVELSQVASEDISVDYASVDESAVSAEDYIEVAGTLTLSAGVTRGTISIDVLSDVCYEQDESLALSLSNISSNAILGNSTANGIIVNDDQKRQLSVADVQLLEGNAGTSNMVFTASLNSPSCYDSHADYTSNMVTADIADFVVVSGSLTIPAGQLQATFNVSIYGDTQYENNETLTVALQNISSHIEAVDVEAFGTLLNDDPPALSVSSATVLESNAGETASLTFFIALEAATDEVSFDYTTANGTANVADGDYVATAGTLSIPAGVTSSSITVQVNGDDNPESDETLQLLLSNVNGFARMESMSAVGTITNDDVAPPVTPELTVRYGQVVEGNAGSSTEMSFEVSLDTAATTAVAVDYSTADADASNGSDYIAETGSVTIAAGDISAQIGITINGDDVAESDETFVLNISNVSGSVDLRTPFVIGRIIDDDAPPGAPRLVAGMASVTEGDSGTSMLEFNVGLTAPATTEVSVDYMTEDVTAIAGSDYTAVSGTLIFPIGITELQVSVPVTGDTLVEADESLNLRLSSVVGNAILATSMVAGTIVSDDPFARISINDVATLEGDVGLVDMLFTVSLREPVADAVSVDYATQDYTANSVDDYIAVANTLLIPAGDTEATFTVSVNGDLVVENDEAFIVALSNPSANAELADAQGDGAISNDDGDGGWGAPELLEYDPDQDARYPQITMNSSGNAMAVWPQEEDDPERNDIVSRRFVSGSGWQTQTFDVSDSDSISASNLGQQPQIAIDAVGNAIAAWRQSSGAPDYVQQLVANRYTVADGWGVPLVLYDNTMPVNPHFINVQSNANGQAVVVWLAENDVSASYDDVWAIKYDPVAGWDSQATRLELSNTEQDTAPVAGIDDAGNIIVVWLQHQVGSCCDQDVYMTRYDAVDDLWSAPAVVEASIDAAASPAVAMRSNGDAVVLWEQGAAGSKQIWARFFTAGIDDWSGAALAIGNGGSFSSSGVGLDVAYAGNGDVFVSWQATTNTLESIWATRFDAAANSGAGAWNAASLLELDDVNSAADPRLAADSLGNAIVVWTQNDGTVDNVRAARFATIDAAWGPAESIEVFSVDNNGMSHTPKIAMDAAGNAQLVWYRQKWNALWSSYTFGVPDIWTVRYTAQ